MAAKSAIIGELEIITVGLATFLPDGSRMHVVMPATHGHAGHGIPEHKAVLFWKSVRFDGPSSPTEGKRLLGRRALEIREVGYTAATPSLPDTLLDLSKEVDDKVDRAVVQDGPKAKVLARLTLALGGRIESGPTADFTLDFGRGAKNPTDEHAMPSFVTWTLPLTATSRLEWRLLDLDNPGDEPFAPLEPVVTPAGDPRITIFHVPEDELPGSPTAPAPAAVGQRVVHFDVYYELFARPTARPIPVLKRLPTAPPGAPVHKGVMTGTCMPTSAELK